MAEMVFYRMRCLAFVMHLSMFCPREGGGGEGCGNRGAIDWEILPWGGAIDCVSCSWGGAIVRGHPEGRDY